MSGMCPRRAITRLTACFLYLLIHGYFLAVSSDKLGCRSISQRGASDVIYSARKVCARNPHLVQVLSR